MKIRANDIYRHMSGVLYLIVAVSAVKVEDVYKDIVILRRLGAEQATMTYYLDDFIAEVTPEDENNIMGQKTKFVLIEDATSPLKETTTEALVAELKTRLDNPYAKEGDPKVYEVYYEVGVYKPVPKKHAEFEGQQYFEAVTTKDTLEDAVLYVQKFWANSRRPVFMRVTRALETTVQEIIDSNSNK